MHQSLWIHYIQSFEETKTCIFSRFLSVALNNLHLSRCTCTWWLYWRDDGTAQQNKSEHLIPWSERNQPHTVSCKLGISPIRISPNPGLLQQNQPQQSWVARQESALTRISANNLSCQRGNSRLVSLQLLITYYTNQPINSCCLILLGLILIFVLINYS